MPWNSGGPSPWGPPGGSPGGGGGQGGGNGQPPRGPWGSGGGGRGGGPGQMPDFDAIIVGAGFAGLYMLHSLRTMGLSVRVYEQGGGVGGTWYWNRYPGARCDSESVYYMFSDHLSEEILGEWNWSERYAAQPEILRYLEFVTDKMDLRRNIQFNAKVISAVYDSERNSLDLRLEDGSTSSARFLVTAVGCLSFTNTPEFPGIETFGGEVAFFLGDPFLQPEMRLDDEFGHGFLRSISATPAVPEPAGFVNALAPLSPDRARARRGKPHPCPGGRGVAGALVFAARCGHVVG